MRPAPRASWRSPVHARATSVAQCSRDGRTRHGRRSRPGSPCSATATTSSSPARAAPARKSASPGRSIWPSPAACRSSPPTTCASSRARTSSPTRRGSASTRARCSPTRPVRAAIPSSSSCAPRPRWRRCSKTCPRPSRTRSNWRDASTSRCDSASRRCRPTRCPRAEPRKITSGRRPAAVSRRGLQRAPARRPPSDGRPTTSASTPSSA